MLWVHVQCLPPPRCLPAPPRLPTGVDTRAQRVTVKRPDWSGPLHEPARDRSPSLGSNSALATFPIARLLGLHVETQCRRIRDCAWRCSISSRCDHAAPALSRAIRCSRASVTGTEGNACDADVLGSEHAPQEAGVAADTGASPTIASSSACRSSSSCPSSGTRPSKTCAMFAC